MTDDPLSHWRDQIDDIDGKMVRLLAERFKITTDVGHWKAKNAVAAIDPDREKRQVKRLEDLAQETGLSHEFLERFLRIIIDEVVKNHRAIRDEDFDAPSPL